MYCKKCFFIFILFCSCSLNELANQQIVESIKRSEQQIEQSENYYLVEKAFPSILLMLDSAILDNPKDLNLLVQGAKTNFLYAALFIEKENENWASLHYKQAKLYAEKYFVHKYQYTVAWDQLDKDNFEKRLESLHKDDIAAVFWLTMSWGGLISMNRDDVTMISHVPDVENLMKKVLAWESNYENGMPYLFLANLNSVTKIDKESFEKAFAVSERNFFVVHIAYAKLLGKFSQDKSLFEELLSEVISKWEKRDKNSTWKNEYNLANAISYDKAKDLIYSIEDFYEDDEEE